MTVWVLWWKYSDGSAADIERVYVSKIRADQDLELLKNSHTSKDYELKEIEVTNQNA